MKNNKLLLAGVLTVTGIAWAVGWAMTLGSTNAQTPTNLTASIATTPSTTTTATSPSLLDQAKQKLWLQETNDDQEELKELTDMKAVTKITLTQAIQIAETQEKTTAHQARLESENGNVVYSVEIWQKEVIIDAGNGSVLDTQDESQDHEWNHSQEKTIKSSVTIVETETNDDTWEWHHGRGDHHGHRGHDDWQDND